MAVAGGSAPIRRRSIATEYHVDRRSQLILREIHEAPGQTRRVTHEWQESLSKRPAQSAADDHSRISSYCRAMYLRVLKHWIERGERVPYGRRLEV